MLQLMGSQRVGDDLVTEQQPQIAGNSQLDLEIQEAVS